ncbi:uncharacterized protein C8Q71DRAFT_304939 [Rhodofomes roseus]|uniref:F-box domain-containing protein n=1 Tax=Rhodofomes roseus TaxID=34475 RepID=A0ABQ8K3K5_9APHY|nr:uncharacterized protein C8Q71DRAFT_304939 [Rhodofomes roseus]KAH9831469.1 hypothetical protein C8Q71DRAFT_304939 [Rhodofomes roseus]
MTHARHETESKSGRRDGSITSHSKTRRKQLVRRWSSHSSVQWIPETELQPLPPTLADRVPAELHFEVINRLSCDTHSLQSCAMVSRAWYPHSIGLLYRRIYIDGLTKFSSMAVCVFKHERVRISLADTAELNLDGACMSDPGRGLESALVVLASLMPSLQKLTLCECLPCPLHKSFYTALRACKSVTDLTLCGIALEDHRVLLRVLQCGFPQLRRVAFEGNFRITHSGPRQSVSPTRFLHGGANPSQLKQLRISISGKSVVIPLIELFTVSSLHTSLETLETRVAEEHVTALNQFLQGLGPTLHRFRELPSLNDHFAHLDLYHNTSLRSVVLYIGHHSLDGIDTVLQLTRALSSLASPHLTRIVLQCSDHPESWKTATVRSFGTADLRPLHAVMASPVFDDLDTVEVDVCRRKSQDVVTALSNLLAPWAVRGLIRFV